jgi:hypothetical protein
MDYLTGDHMDSNDNLQTQGLAVNPQPLSFENNGDCPGNTTDYPPAGKSAHEASRSTSTMGTFQRSQRSPARHWNAD